MRLTVLKNIFLFLTLILVGQRVTAQCPLDIGQLPTINTNGLILYFPFNGNATNQGSGSYTTTVSGATYTTGICGQAMDFDGVDDYVKLNPFVPMTGSFTIAAWIFVDSMTIGQSIFATRDQCATTYRGYSQCEFGINHYNSVVGGGPNRIRFMVNQHQNCTGYSAGDRYYPPNYYYSSGSWHLIALTVQNNSQENRIVKFYIDCQQLGSYQYMDYPSGVSFNPNNNNKSFIGAGSQVPNYIYSFNGKIDEFRLYNHVLNMEELRSLYYNCKPLDVSISKYLGNCTGDSAMIELINTQNGVTYQLFDSTNQQNIGTAQNGNCGSLFFNTGLVTTPSVFYIKALRISSNCKIILDTLINLNPSSVGNILNDSIELCKGDSVLLRGHFYSAPNLVSDTLIDINGCDSILNTSLLTHTLPFVDLGNDTAFCDGDSVKLSLSNNYYSVLWNTGSNSNSIYANTTGTYWVEVSDSICNNSDTIQVSNLSHSYISINDTSFCEGDSWTISLPASNSYLWSTGSTGYQITLQDSGRYWIQIQDGCKKYTENFSVNLLDCSCMIVVPNVFTPNGDGLNETFFPVISCELNYYHLYIFNRWGQLLYETESQYDVWDAKYQGKPVPDGVYFYLIEYVHLLTSENRNERRGSVTVLR